MSQTQAIMDYYGVSKASAAARENGGIPVNTGLVPAENYYAVVGGDNPIWSEYTYSATNVRLQEAHISYDVPKKWPRPLSRSYSQQPLDDLLQGSFRSRVNSFYRYLLPGARLLHAAKSPFVRFQC